MVEPQGWGPIEEGLGAPMLRVLAERRGMPTIVRMANGEECVAYAGSGWARDYGDRWEHVIARLTPLGSEPRDEDHRFFYLSEVESLLEPETREILQSQAPAPGET